MLQTPQHSLAPVGHEHFASQPWSFLPRVQRGSGIPVLALTSIQNGQLWAAMSYCLHCSCTQFYKRKIWRACRIPELNVHIESLAATVAHFYHGRWVSHRHSGKLRSPTITIFPYGHPKDCRTWFANSRLGLPARGHTTPPTTINTVGDKGISTGLLTSNQASKLRRVETNRMTYTTCY